jgi:hypothetical protein
MRDAVFPALILALLTWPASADESIAAAAKPQAPVCTPQAKAAYVKLPALVQVSGYAKRLEAVLRPNWWQVPADELSACGGKSNQEDPGTPEIQGTGRVRELVVPMSHDEDALAVVLVVKGDQGVVVTERQVPFEDPHNPPESLAVAQNGAETLAIFDSTFTMNGVEYLETSIYKVDLASGTIAADPLFVSPDGATNKMENSWSMTDDGPDMADLAPQKNGKLAQKFINVTANSCDEGDDNCEPMTQHSYAWNGSAFVMDKSGSDGTKPLAGNQKAPRFGLSKLRQCLKTKFDPKTGTAACDIGTHVCESDNDLSFLSYKSGNMSLAQNHAAKALEECKNNPKELAAAQFNDRRAHSNSSK